MNDTPFIVFGLPRSRTYWLSRFLSYGQWKCYHDRSVWFRSLDDIKAWLSQPFTGTVETAAAPFWRHLLRERPDLKVVTVRRPVEECLDSWMRIQPNADADAILASLRKLDRKLDQIETRVPSALRVEFSDLSSYSTAEALFLECLGLELDAVWAQRMFARNEQINVAAQTRYMQANAKAISKLRGHLRQRELSALARKSPEASDLVFGWEDPHEFWRDGQPLFRSHMVRTEQGVSDFEHKNIPLMKLMYDHGAFKIASARCNGRLVAYLLVIIAPSLDDENIKMAEYTAIFSDPAFPGSWGKLEWATEDMLIAEGVTIIQGRSGVLGDGPRMGTFYLRRGFEEFGKLYRKEVA